MIMRTTCDRSKFNYLSGGLLAPRGFLILLFKDWKLLIVPLLYQGDVLTNKQAASCPQRTRTAKAIDQSIHQAREIPHYVHNRALVHRQLSEAEGVAQGRVTSVPVSDLHNAFLSPQHCPALEERQPPHLRHTLSSSSVLTPSLIPAPWAEHSADSPPLKAPLPTPHSASVQHKPPAPTTHSREVKSLHLPCSVNRNLYENLLTSMKEGCTNQSHGRAM